MILEMAEGVSMLMSKNMHGQEITLAHLTIAWLEVEMRYAQKLILRKPILSPQKISLSNK